MIFINKNILNSWFCSLKILIVTVGCLWMSNGCINKMELPADINTDVEFSAGDTTYLPVNPIWGTERGFQSPIEISIAQDGRIFVADSAAQSIFVLDQGGNIVTGFDELRTVTVDGNSVHPIDVDIDTKMNVFFIDGSDKIFCWNQLWNLLGIEAYAFGGIFLTETGEDSFIVSHNESWLTAVNNTNWELIDVTWSNEQSVIDSLLSARCVFDGQSADTTGDIWYSSGMSSFSGLTTLRDEAMQIFTSDYFHDRILALNMRRSHLIRLSSGQEIWTHDLVFGHTVSEYGTGAGTVNKPVCIDSDGNGNLYYGQTGDFFQIHKIQPVLGGTYPVYPSVFQPGINDIMDLYRFESPRDVTVDNHQSVYVANTMEQEVQVFDNDGQFFMKAGVESVTVDTSIWIFIGADSVLTDTFLVVEKKEYLEYPSAVAVDEKGVIYVCDPSSSSIVRFRLSNQLDENLNPIK